MNTSEHDEQLFTQEGAYIVESWENFQLELKRDKNLETLDISQVFGFVALVYERVRTMVENKDEHVIRRFAIERALKRMENVNKPHKEKALRLIKELTWSRFVPNNSISRGKIQIVADVLEKYEILEKSARGTIPKRKELEKVREWILSIASTELEEILAPSFVRLHLVPTMYVWLKTRFEWKNKNFSDEQLETQLFIAAHRALAKSDVAILRYHLFVLLYPEWRGAASNSEMVANLGGSLKETIAHIESLINFEYKNQIFRLVQKNTPPFIFIDAILRTVKEPRAVLSNVQRLEEETKEIAREKYAKIRTDLRKGTIRSIVYIFATKVVIAVGIEYPYERFYLDHVNWTSIGINLLTPPVLMFLMAMTVSIPGDDNTSRILGRMKNILLPGESDSRKMEARIPVINKQRLSRVFTLIYAYIFVMVVLFLGFFLHQRLHFNIVSMGLFFMFVSLVLLFGFRLRWQAMELLMAKPKQSILDHLLSILSIPFINLGVWLSSSLSKINLITFVLDKLIDAPLKSGVNSAEEWTEFLKERQDQAVEVPG